MAPDDDTFEGESIHVVRHKLKLGKYEGGYNDEKTIRALNWAGEWEAGEAARLRDEAARQRRIDHIYGAVIAIASAVIGALLTRV